MRITLPAASHASDLLRFLRQMGYVADEVAYGIVRVDEDTLPETALGVAPMSLAIRLGVWNAVNGDQAQLVSATGPLEP